MRKKANHRKKSKAFDHGAHREHGEKIKDAKPKKKINLFDRMNRIDRIRSKAIKHLQGDHNENIPVTFRRDLSLLSLYYLARLIISSYEGGRCFFGSSFLSNLDFAVNIVVLLQRRRYSCFPPVSTTSL